MFLHFKCQKTVTGAKILTKYYPPLNSKEELFHGRLHKAATTGLLFPAVPFGSLFAIFIKNSGKEKRKQT